MTGMRLPDELRGPLLAAVDESAIVAVTDTAGRITYANDLFCKVSGYEPEELIGANHRLLNSGEHPPEFFREMYRVIAAGKTWRGTICNRRKSGELYWVETSIVPSLGPDGRPHSYVSFRVEVTQHIRVQHALQSARAAAERASVARGRFLANLSHELRTPLTALIGFAEVLARTALKTDQKDSVEAIRDSAEAMRDLVNDVLALAQTKAGGPTVSPRPTDLRIVADGCVKMVAVRAAEKDLTVRCKVSPDVPATGLIDPVRLRQVLLNLLGNAVKFTGAGEITLSLDWIDDTLRCEVVDTGCGFAPEDKERLFAAFEQTTDQNGRSPEGAGLGLPICRSLVNAMGGAIDGDGRPGEGARFWFTAPCPAIAVAAEAEEIPLRAGADILVVEDCPEIQRLMTTVLKAAGHWVQVAGDGKAALDALRQRPFDLCLMDLRMPVMGGEDAVRAIRADSDARVRATPVVAVSAEAEQREHDRFLQLGFDDAVAKPLNIGALLSTVETWRARPVAAAGARAA